MQRKCFSAMVVLGLCLPTFATFDSAGVDEGLTVIQSAVNSFSAVFRSGGNVIYMDANRGEPRPEQFQETPGEVMYEVDVRFAEGNGRIFLAARGGDQWVDPLWQHAIIRSGRLLPRKSTRVLLAMAGEAAKILEDETPARLGARQTANLKPELTALKEMGVNALLSFKELSEASLHDETNTGNHQTPDRLKAPRMPQTPDLAQSQSTWPEYFPPLDEDFPQDEGFFRFALWAKDIGVGGGMMHSATAIFRMWGGEAVYALHFCNHGSCGTSSSMTLRCFLPDIAKENAWTIYSCHTAFHAASNKGHNCHDDSRMQMASYQYVFDLESSEPADPWKWWCDGDRPEDISSRPGDQGGAPYCSSHKTKGYQHPRSCVHTGSCGGWNSSQECSCNSNCADNGNCCLDAPACW